MFSNPKQNVSLLDIREGMRVADFGSGTGYYAKFASMKVGPSGRVYAVEVQKGMVRKLEDEFKKDGIDNVECIWGDIEINEGTKIAEKSLDAVIVSNVLFQVTDKLGLVDEVKRVLKNGGRVLVVDWMESFGGMGPAPHHVVKEKIAEELFTRRGFKVVEKIPQSDHHYGIIFRRDE